MSPTCTICGTSAETGSHALVFCPWSRQVWEVMKLHHLIRWLENLPSIDDIARKKLSHLPSACFLTMWTIWIERNGRIFNNKVRPQTEIVRAASWLIHTVAAPPRQSSPPPAARSTTWNPDHFNGVVLHTDGSLQSNGRAGFGAVLRTSDGTWISGCSGYVGKTGILEAEILAILNGLRHALEKGIRSINCYSDSKEAIRLLAEEPPPSPQACCTHQSHQGSSSPVS